MSYEYELLILFVLILCNGLFALSEIAIISSRKPRLRHLSNKGNIRAKAALDLANNPDHFLSTVQAGITLVGIFTGAFGGYTLAEPISETITNMSIVGEYAEVIALILVVLPITYFSIILGELLPKQLALRNPERIAMLVAIPMKSVSYIMHPIVRVLSFSTNFVIRSFNIKASDEPAVTEEEIKVMIEEGTLAGTFDAAEQDIVENVFRLGDKRVNAVMTPRTEIIWLDIEDPLQENLKKITEHKHSFFPVCKGTIDHVIGIISAKDLLYLSISGKHLNLDKGNLRTPLYMVESMPAFKAIDEFKKQSMHFALLVDEYGSIQGLITLYDIIKALVGEELTKLEHEDPYIITRIDGSFLVDGALMIDEFQEKFQVELSEEESGNYQTIAGFVINQMGKIPSAGQFFEWRNWRIEIVDMDGNRVDKLLIQKIPDAERS